MSKFKVRLKLQGLELEVEGNRDDVPLIADSVAEQVAGLLKPASNIVEGEIVTDGHRPQYVEGETSETKTKQARKKRQSQTQPGSNSKEEAVDWSHDPSKWGVPKQKWSTADKSLWILYVVEKAEGIKEMSAPRIATTFNKHFPQAGIVHPPNVSRDLGKLKLKSPALVSEDRAKSPSTWFLTEGGIQRVEKLIRETLGDSIS